MTIQDLHVGDKLLVYLHFPDIFEVEVLDIRGEYAKLRGLDGHKFWKTNFSDWTLIEKLVDGKELLKWKQELYSMKLAALNRGLTHQGE